MAEWLAEPNGPGIWLTSARDHHGPIVMDLTEKDIHMMRSVAAISRRYWWMLGAVYGPIPKCPESMKAEQQYGN